MRWLLAALLLVACEVRRPGGPAAGRVELLAAPAAGDIPTWVRATAATLRGRGRIVLVYEGASWCEPCKRFHDAAAAGALDDALPTLTLLEFDADRDADRLEAAGYTSRLIPLFAVPGADGRATGRSMDGGIKGEGAVGQILPRLQALIASP